MKNAIARALLALAIASTLGACARATGPVFDSETGAAGAGGAAGAAGTASGAAGQTAGAAGTVNVDPGPAGAAGEGGAAGSGVNPFPDEGQVYVHTLYTLFRFEPIAKTLVKVGDFGCFDGLLGATADAGMRDIAIDRDGKLYGSAKLGTPEAGSRVVIVTIDPATAQCTEVFGVADTGFEGKGLSLWGLSFVPQADGDQLFGLDQTGLYLRIDLTKKEIVQVGNLNPPGDSTWFTKGADIVSIKGDRTYTTAGRDNAGDRLLAINPATGVVEEEIGLLGKFIAGGLAYWGGVVYAFTSDGAILAVDTTTGSVTQIPVPILLDTEFQGAGVTTLAPILIK